MRDVTPIEKLVLEKEADEIGGMIILILGEPGAGKTMALVVMVEKDLEQERKPLWTGQKTCQWITLAAQGMPITMWIHDSVEDYQFYTKGSLRSDIPRKDIDLTEKEDLDIEFESFSQPKEIVEGIKPDRVNVYFIPGADGGEKEKYFFQKMNYKLAQALNQRDYGDHITWNVDEIQNVAPDYNHKPFHDLQMNLFPKEWEDLRKESVSKRGTGHGYAEMNWKYYDLKANGIVYMQGGKVHDNHSQIDQNLVNGMDRGEFVVNGFETGEFKLPDDPKKVFDWIKDHEDVELRMEISADIPDIRPEPDTEEWINNQPFNKDHLDDLIDAEETADLTSYASRVVKRKFQTSELPAIKLNGKWFTSRTAIINEEDVPS